ncbi:xylulokinase [Mesorhizobium yinganensis]|uniref:xylulokinase n=1 Tax=Mesorhizobium yinganensis TaxID=3157707 RepID=UPI0032B75668
MAVVGIDLGTQSLKAIVVDDRFRIRGEASVPYQPRFPAPGWAEQDPALWLAALRLAIRKALDAGKLKPRDIKGIAVSGQLDGCVPVDYDGSPLAPCIIWMDRRAVGEVAGIDAARIRERTGLVLDASHMAAKIRWMKRHLPETAACRTWHQPVSFLVERLCGEAVMDHALASTTMLYGLEERGYAGDLLDLFEVEREQMPLIGEASAAAGALSPAGAELTGLPAGITVAVGTGDDFANAIGAGVVEPGIVSVSLGTGEVIGVVSDERRLDGEGLVQTHGYVGGRYYLGNPGWLAGGAVTWFLSTFGIGSPAELSALAASAAPGSGDLLFLPALNGAMAPRWIEGARGALYGLTPAHGRAACARALLEGCAFAMRDVVARLEAMGVETGRIRLCGGGARSRIWAQIRADVSRRPVEVLDAADTSPIGAAILAGVAVGNAASVAEAAAATPRTVDVIMPDLVRADIYDRCHRRYRTLFEALTPLYAEDA